jgi:hypothetical protein
MADVSDVAAGLANTIAVALWPGMNAPNPANLTRTQIVSNAVQLAARVITDWPSPDKLTKDFAANGVVVSIYTVPGNSRDTTGYATGWQSVKAVPITVNTTVAANSVTFDGTGTAGQVVGVGYGLTGWAFRLTGSTAPTDLATAFAATIPGASASGAVLTLATSLPVMAPVVSDSLQFKLQSSQVQRFSLQTWAPTRAAADAIGKIINVAMASTRAIPMPDGSFANKPKYMGTDPHTMDEKASIFRRDEVWEVEYITTVPLTTTGILFGSINMNNVQIGLFKPT